MTKAANGQHMLNMCSHITAILAKPDVFCTKKCSRNLPWQIKNVFCKKISEIFDLLFFFLGFLKHFDVFCRRIFVNFDPFPLLLGFLAN